MKKKIAKILSEGGVGVLPTDTIYGLVGRAMDKSAVSRIIKLKKRSPKKPFIILISALVDLDLFGIKPGIEELKILKKFWPGKVSVVLRCKNKKFKYLHRGTNHLAIRLLIKSDLVKIIKKTGPLVAPSANPEGLPPANTIAKAKKYFGDKVDFYENGGRIIGKASTLISLTNGELKVLRKGAVKIR